MTRHCWSETAAASPARLSNIISSYFNMGYVSSQHQDLSTLTNNTTLLLPQIKKSYFRGKCQFYLSFAFKDDVDVDEKKRWRVWHMNEVWIKICTNQTQVDNVFVMLTHCWHLISQYLQSSQHVQSSVCNNQWIYLPWYEWRRMREKEIKYTL